MLQIRYVWKFWVWACIALLLTVGTVGTVSVGHAGDSIPELQTPKGKPCVRDSEWMKRNHMDFLKHKREVTVREGERIRNESLFQCSTCHTNRTQFCDRCHHYVGVDPDCFQCHNYPQ